MMPTNPAIRSLRSARRKFGEMTDPLFKATTTARDAGITWSQIADVLELPVATVKSRYAGGQAGLEVRRAAARKRAKRRPVVRVPAPDWPGLSLAEAAEWLEVSTETVRRRVHAGALRGGWKTDSLGRRAMRVQGLGAAGEDEPSGE